MEIRSEIDLMAFIMWRLADRFRAQAVLRGGMALCLLDSPRYTNDLDYVFVPYESKKDSNKGERSLFMDRIKVAIPFIKGIETGMSEATWESSPE